MKTKEEFKQKLLDAGCIRYTVDIKKAAEILGVSKSTVNYFLQNGCDKNSHIEKLQAETERLKEIGNGW